MLFPNRTHHVVDVCGVGALAEKLTQHVWTLCTGFRLAVDDQVTLFLNDSISEDGAQEYAVFTPDGQQLETITFGWCNQPRAEELIRRVLASDAAMGRFGLRLDESPDHVCHLCR